MEINKNARKNIKTDQLCKHCKNKVDVVMVMPGKRMKRLCCLEAA